MHRLFLTVCVALVTFASQAAAQVELKWKVPENSKWSVKTEVLLEQKLSLAGMDVDTKANNVTITEYKSEARKADGTLPVTSRVNSMKVNLSLPGGVDLEYDSSKGPQPQGTQFDSLLDMYQAMSKTVTTYMYDKNNRVTSAEVDQKPFKDLDETTMQQIKGTLDGNYLKDTANKEMDAIPTKPVKKGDTWDSTMTLRLGGGQAMTFKSSYTYEGEVEKDGKKYDKITTKVQSVDFAQEPGGPARVTKSELKPTSSNGVILFDRTTGRIAESDERMRLQGSMTIEVGDQTLDATIDLRIDAKKTMQ